MDGYNAIKFDFFKTDFGIVSASYVKLTLILLNFFQNTSIPFLCQPDNNTNPYVLKNNKIKGKNEKGWGLLQDSISLPT